ncbi:MAG: lipopolysaccharide heptosyltransferase II [Candidatus Tantalella remota]|nr:lipopolysaccharide heptosyltransferase II [Candidatus Tantalella remota]
MHKKTDPENIIILRTDRIGEVLLSTVVVDAVKGESPDARITFATSGYSKPIVEGRTDIEEVMVVDVPEKKGWFAGSLALAKRLREKRFDAAIILNPHKALHLACFLAGIPVRVGLNRKWGFLLTSSILDERYTGEKHEIEYALDVLGPLGITAEPSSPRLEIDDSAQSYADALLKEKGNSSKKALIAVHPGSSNPAKIWPHERYEGLIRKIAAEMDCDVAVLGSGDEKELVAQIVRESDAGAIDLSGKLDLRQLAAVLNRATVFIGNDNGPMHMAAALGVPVMAIFGRDIPGVSPRRWRPWGDKNVVFHEPPGCDPCVDTECPYEYKCLKAITVDAVFDAVKKTVNSR